MFVNSGGLRLWCLMFKKTWSKKTLIVTTGLNDEKKKTNQFNQFTKLPEIKIETYTCRFNHYSLDV